MASFLYVTGLKEVLDQTHDITAATNKVMLVKSGYVQDPDNDLVDAGGADDALDHELTVSGYTGGHGGAGRKAWGTITVTANKTDNRADVGVGADLTWTSLATGETIAGAILINEAGGADTSTRLLCYWDITDTPTTGGDVTLDFTPSASGGNIRISV